MIQNIFLDFLNRDTREINGLQGCISATDHVNWICEVLNIAVFLCSEFCIAPPGFLAECDIAKKATDRRSEFLTERLIRLPMREDDLGKYWDKKEREYGQFKKRYSGLFKPKGHRFINKHSGSLIKRTSIIGNEICKSWEEGLDVNPIWDSLKKEVEPRKLEQIRPVPKLLREIGQAVTWSAINGKIREVSGVDNPGFRHVLQNHYFRIYIAEYRLKVVTGLPFCRDSFGLASDELYYNYEALKGALSTIGMWNLIRYMSAPSLILLRYKSGYFSFRDFFHDVTARCISPVEITQIFSAIASNLKPILKETKQIKRFTNPNIIPRKGFTLSEDEINAVAFVFEAMSNRLDYVNEKPSDYKQHYFSLDRGGVIMPSSIKQKQPKIGIFVALKMERDILVDRWNLKSAFPDPIWNGQVGSFEFSIFCPDKMGRVPAAVLTMSFLSKVNPDMLIVAGIAGGFEAQEVQLGDVIVANNVADLATRKVKEDEKGIIPEFRPTVFQTDSRIKAFLDSTAFDENQWQAKVTKEEEWPDGRRPTIRYGDIASSDEVVSSDEWSKNFFKYWPKLYGVEMEAGGVCTAADHHELKVAVIRGISDLANPAKSDDEWRKRSMKTVANLLECVDFELILTEKDKRRN